MNPSQFFSDPLNAEIATLLIACPIDDQEKRQWFEDLPEMNEEEKTALRDNLREEFNNYAKLQKLTVDMLVEKIKKL